MMHKLIKSASSAVIGTIFLAGCQTAPPTLYQWEGYQVQVYQHFKGQSPEQQIAEMEKGLQVIQAKGGAVPPGFYAHLGMLYSVAGKAHLVIHKSQSSESVVARVWS